MSEIEQYLTALAQLKGRDRIGVGADVAATGAATLAGAVSSGSVASFFGATTLLGSSTLGSSVLGTVFVTTTPVGWVVGSAVAAGAVGYGIAYACRSGAKNDQVRRKYEREIKKIVEKSLVSSKWADHHEKLVDVLERGVSEGILAPTEVEQWIRQVPELDRRWKQLKVGQG